MIANPRLILPSERDLAAGRQARAQGVTLAKAREAEDAARRRLDEALAIADEARREWHRKQAATADATFDLAQMTAIVNGLQALEGGA